MINTLYCRSKCKYQLSSVFILYGELLVTIRNNAFWYNVLCNGVSNGGIDEKISSLKLTSDKTLPKFIWTWRKQSYFIDRKICGWISFFVRSFSMIKERNEFWLSWRCSIISWVTSACLFEIGWKSARKIPQASNDSGNRKLEQVFVFQSKSIAINTPDSL